MGDHRRKWISFTLFLVMTLISLINGGDIDSIQLNDDVLGLIVFKSDLHDPSSHLNCWNEDDVSPCSWSYVKCNPKTSRVTELSLSGLGLTGKIGRGIPKLQHLKILSLSHNNLTGDIMALSNNNNLQKLDLSHNNLSGLIPSSLGSTTYLDLTGNSFSGTLSDGLFTNCSSLTYLSLSHNHLESQIPSTLFRCSVLNSLNLSSNRFSGSPNVFWKLERLRTLDLSFNALSGSIPLGILSLHSLKVLQLQGNQFSGPLPSEIGLCPHLNRVDLSFNRFSGELPTTLQRLKSLNHLDLSKNFLSGGIPVWIGDMTGLVHLDFSKNELTGAIPSSVSNLRSLKVIHLSENKLSGVIPKSLESCKELVSVQLKGNGFVGNIPVSFFDLGLQEIDFSGNGLTGLIPRGSSRLFESLVTLDLSCNSLTGSITGEVRLFSNLRYLNLSWNNFNTRVPSEIEFLQNLTVLDLRNNALIGSVPGDICVSHSLQILQLDGNSLTGSIPEGIGNCSSLKLLSLSHNILTGPIPKSLSNLQDLKILELEANKLSGEIPKELGGLHNLLLVNISFNRLTGKLPNGGVFQSLDKSALQGNLGICSPLLRGPCIMNVSKPIVIDPNSYTNMNNNEGVSRNHGSTKYQHGMFLSVSVVVAISAAILIFLGVVIVTLLNASVRRRLAFVDNALESIFSGSSRSGRSLVVGKLVMLNSRSSRSSSSSQEFALNPDSLLNKASRIGEGVFGTVYKAPLGEQGRNLAVKKFLPSPIIETLEDFDREVRILAKAKHPNLVSIKGYYWTPEMKLLVSEYIRNGNLQTKLHGREPSAPPLPWDARYRIILGTAKGLAYLHHTFHPATVHFNLKPTNILLDENHNPKISDFGLSRLLTQDGNTTNNNMFHNSLGYIAPELECQNLRANEKCDVYGFGVLILELVTGRRPVEYGEDSFVILSDHVRVLLEHGNVLECIDPTMEEEYSEDEVLPVVKLALVCTSRIPSNRPTMAEIVQILQVITSPVPHRMLDSF